MTTLVWLRRDLRLADNPALAEAGKLGPVLPVYILDETEPRPDGAASRWWLHHSLASLAKTLPNLTLLRGDPATLLPELVRQTGAARVHWNRCYEPHAIARDGALKAALKDQGVEVQSFNGALLNEPWEVTTGGGGPYKVYTPFWRACLKLPLLPPAPAPKLTLAKRPAASLDLAGLDLQPKPVDWAKGWDALWQPGEAGAAKRLEAFVTHGLKGYAELRDRPDLPNTSRLSAHLHFGEISPRQVLARVRFAAAADPTLQRDADKFAAEIGWREFAQHLLYHFPEIPTRNWKADFDAYPWASSPKHLRAWQRGKTGYPLVDAGMRELWQTGTMHNRVRMVAASFLTKHLRIDWRLGEAWFWDTLLDADLANNVSGWQWVAGSGADAAPYFRIFNPTSQSERFDPEGAYVRTWCPELAKLPDRLIHAPDQAPVEILRAAGVVLGKTYPRPIVDHAEARAAALAGYERVKGG